MTCKPEVLKNVPLFALLDDEETAVLAGQVEVKTFAPHERIYKAGDPGAQAYVMISGSVQVTTVDEDQQEVVVDQPGEGDFFGFAAMLEQTPHQTTAIALTETECLEVSRNDIAVLLQQKPLAGMDLLTTLGHQLHASQQLVRLRAARNPNELIEAGIDLWRADSRLSGGLRRLMDVHHYVRDRPDRLHAHQYLSRGQSLGSLSVHSAQSVSFHAGRYSGASDHDEPESPGHEGQIARRTRF